MPDNINFVPDTVISDRKFAEVKKNSWFASVSLLILISLITVGLYFYNNRLSVQASEIISQIDLKNQEIESLSQFGKTGYLLGLRLENAKNIINKRGEYSKLLKVIKDKTPSGIEVQNINVNGLEVTIQGISVPNHNPIAVFKSNLIQLDDKKTYFDNVNIVSTVFNKSKGNVTFKMTAIVNSEKLYGTSSR